jgi:hypothetical protein
LYAEGNSIFGAMSIKTEENRASLEEQHMEPNNQVTSIDLSLKDLVKIQGDQKVSVHLMITVQKNHGKIF